MAIDHSAVDDRISHPARAGTTRRRRWDRRLMPRMWMLASLFSLVVASLAMLMTAVIVRFAADGQPGEIKAAVVAIGTAMGASLAGWSAQPALTRLASRTWSHRDGEVGARDDAR